MSYYTSLMFGHAEGKTVASKMMAQFKEDNMPIHNLRTLVRDGPNVNKTIFRMMEQDILHTVHNAFGKGLDKLPVDIDQMCLDVHALFKHSAARGVGRPS